MHFLQSVFQFVVTYHLFLGVIPVAYVYKRQYDKHYKPQDMSSEPFCGQDITSDLTVTFDEAAFGCDKMITLTGSDGRKQTLQLHIPAGMEDGKSLRLQGKGGAGVNGAPAGDLLICIHVAEKPGFTRKGADVYTTANIPFTTAVLGGEAIINTLNGRVSCRIKPGTQSGSKIRLKGKGIVSMKDSSVHGDQYVTVQIEVPRNLNAAAKNKLKEYEALASGNARTA